MNNNLRRLWQSQFTFKSEELENNGIRDVNYIIQDTLYKYGNVVLWRDPERPNSLIYVSKINGGVSRINRYGEAEEITLLLLGWQKTVKRDDCIILYNDSTRIVPRLEVNKYGRKLKQLDTAMEKNLNKLKSANIIVADKNTQHELTKSLTAARDYDFIVTSEKITPVDTITLNEQYLIDRYQLQKDVLFNEFLTNMGIDNINGKRERMNNDEVNANNNRIDLLYKDMLNTRLEFIEKAYKKFGIIIDLVENNKPADEIEEIDSMGGAYEQL